MKTSPKKKSLIITDSRMRCKNKWICKTVFAEELLFWVGSVGKTQLTRVWCCQHRACPGGILWDCDWVDLQGAQDPKVVLMYQRLRTLNLICSLQQFHFRGFDYSPWLHGSQKCVQRQKLETSPVWNLQWEQWHERAWHFPVWALLC